MTLTNKLIPAITVTSLAPLFFAILLVGCNFQAVHDLPIPGLQKEPLQISLDIPKGYTPAQEIKQKTWEDVAAGAQRLALNGPENTAPAMVTTPVAQVKASRPVLAKAKKKSKHFVMASKRRAGRKLVTATSKKFWKPVRLVSRD